MNKVKILTSDQDAYNSFMDNKSIEIISTNKEIVDNEEYYVIEFKNIEPKKVFLGGSVYKSHWREDIIPELEIDFFNPVVSAWNDAAQQLEEEEKAKADYRLYVITNVNSAWSIAEVIDDVNNCPEKVLFCIHKEILNNGKLSIDHRSMKNLNKIKDLVELRGGKVFDTLDQVVDFLNDNK